MTNRIVQIVEIMLEFLQTEMASQHGRPSPEAVTSDDIIRMVSTLAPLLQNLQGAKTPSVFPPFQFGAQREDTSVFPPFQFRAQPSSEKEKRSREDASVIPPFQFGAQPSSEKEERNQEDDDFSMGDGIKQERVDILRQDNNDVPNFLAPDKQPIFNIPDFSLNQNGKRDREDDGADMDSGTKRPKFNIPDFPLNQNGKRDREDSNASMNNDGIKRPRFNATNFLSPIKREQEEDDNDHPSPASTVAFGSRDAGELNLGDFGDGLSQRLSWLRP
ncbi:hypothetical protein B0T14DRAFT_549359 [Immersiella caudata]|uniref:Uncharacterized protein n=1 Tax=Immersiella caudata TaxID=314043 RepID=A0AA40CAI8_9PEZI|nr:hypothetical protein B0T14DRAFT_549359 [Immersiella caudata]